MGRAARLRHLGLVTSGGAPLRREPPKVALGFSFGTLHWPFVRSLLALVNHEQAAETKIITDLIPQPGLYIGENRNRAVQCFLRTKAEWLLQIDTDIEFPPDLPETMVSLAGADRKILAASVPLSPPIPGCAMNRRPEMPGEWRWVPEDEITEEGIEVDAVATAVILIHRDVFAAIADQVGQCWFLQTGPGAIMPDVRDLPSRAAWTEGGPMSDRKYTHVGEDVLFCMRAEDAGFRSHCAKVSGLRHYKVVPLTHDDAEMPPTKEAAG